MNRTGEMENNWSIAKCYVVFGRLQLSRHHSHWEQVLGGLWMQISQINVDFSNSGQKGHCIIGMYIS